jgi:hypothetical protein
MKGGVRSLVGVAVIFLVCMNNSSGYCNNQESCWYITGCGTCTTGANRVSTIGACVSTVSTGLRCGVTCCCNPGSYETKTSCVQCPVGMFSTQYVTACANCSVGFFTNQTGTSSCKSCSTGAFCPNTGMIVPILCPIGKYANSSGWTSCGSCPAGSFCPSSGTALAKPCPAGYFSNQTEATTCTRCPMNYFSSSGQSYCSNCPEGYSLDTNSSECSICPAGKYGSQAGVSFCSDCPEGTFCPDEGTSQPIPCSLGTFSNVSNSTSCDSCQNGTYSAVERQTACYACLAGQGYISKNEPCRLCEPGKYSSLAPSFAHECVACEFGKWMNMKGSTVCKDCPQVSSQVTCAQGSIVPLVSGSGWFRKLTDAGNIRACYPPESCPLTGENDTICAAEYTGDVCSSCSSGYFRNGGKCVKCISTYARWSVLSISLILLVIGLNRFLSTGDKVPPQFRTLLFWFQFLSLYPALSSAWPPVLFRFLNFTSIFNFDFGYLGMGCDIDSGYLQILRFKIILPFILFVLISVDCLIMVALKKLPKFSFLNVVSRTIYITYFFAIQLLSSMFQVFNCVQSGSKTLLNADPSIECFASEWGNFMIFDGIFIAFYVFIVPGFVIFLFRSGKKKNIDLIKPLFQGYREGAEWFEFVRFLFRFGFVLIRDAFGFDSSSKVLFLAFLLLSVLWVESRARPYLNEAQQDLSML